MSSIRGFIGKPYEHYAMLKTVTGRTTLPVVYVYLDSELYTCLISVAVVEEMHLNGVGCILAKYVMQNSTYKGELPCLLSDPRRTSEEECMPLGIQKHFIYRILRQDLSVIV